MSSSTKRLSSGFLFRTPPQDLQACKDTTHAEHKRTQYKIQEQAGCLCVNEFCRVQVIFSGRTVILRPPATTRHRHAKVNRPVFRDSILHKGVDSIFCRRKEIHKKSVTKRYRQRRIALANSRLGKHRPLPAHTRTKKYNLFSVSGVNT